MIRSLRSLHRLALPVLGLVSGGVFVGAVMARRSQPVVSTLPERFYQSNLKSREVFGSVVAIGTIEILLARVKEDGKDVLVIGPHRDPGRADVLVYWSATEPDKQTFPSNATLLGSLAGTTTKTFPLPPAASGKSGFVTLYSLATREVIGTAQRY